MDSLPATAGMEKTPVDGSPATAGTENTNHNTYKPHASFLSLCLAKRQAAGQGRRKFAGLVLAVCPENPSPHENRNSGGASFFPLAYRLRFHQNGYPYRKPAASASNTIIYQSAPETLDKAQLLGLVNQYRRAGCNCGGQAMPPVGEVRWNDVLARAAQAHSNDMARKSFFSHKGSDGSDAGVRVQRQGYSYATYGENIANGYPNEKAVVEGWIKSPGHCKNIMDKRFKEMGVGASGSYWTQVFGTQR